jgi:hypothetical protein
VGSRSKIDLAYIAGFLDGDGSLMLQLKKRKDSIRGVRFMVTICFYQDSRHDSPLSWIREVFGIGYLSHRNDGMTELRINGYKQVQSILQDLIPYLRFKRVQAQALVQACEILCQGTLKTLAEKDIKILIELLLRVQNENYATHKKKDKVSLYTIFGLTP